MFCEKCGSEIKKGNFCTHCGHKLAQSTVAVSSPVVNNAESADRFQPTVQSSTKKKQKILVLILSTVVIAFLAMIGYFINNNFRFLAKREVVLIDSKDSLIDKQLTKKNDKDLETLLSDYQEEENQEEQKNQVEKIDKKLVDLIKIANEALDREDYVALAKAYTHLKRFNDTYTTSAIYLDETYVNKISLPKDELEALKNTMIDKADVVFSQLNATQDATLIVGIYDEEFADTIDKAETLSILTTSFAESGDFMMVNRLLKKMLHPISEERLAATTLLKVDLSEKYGDRIQNIEYLSDTAYQQVMPAGDGFFKFNIDGKWGCLSTDGKVVSEAKYDVMGNFLEGMAAVKLGEKWGFIDKKGALKVPIVFDDLKAPNDTVFYAYALRNPENIARGFYNNFAAVKKDNKWGFVNKNGQPLGPGYIFDGVQVFNEGYGVVDIDQQYGLIDSEGNYLIEPKKSKFGMRYNVVRPIFEGLAGVNWNNRTSRGIINKNGDLVHAFNARKVDLVQDFREGLASVRKTKYGKEQWGFVNMHGDIVIPTDYDSVTIFIEGRSIVSKNGKFGVINRQGRQIYSLMYDEIDYFNNGVTKIRNGNKYALGNAQGQLLTEFGFDKINDFSNGYAGFSVDDRWGLIDENGTVITQPFYEEIKAFNNGVAPAMYNGKWGFIDITGFFMIDPIYSDVLAFNNGVAAVKQDGVYKFIKMLKIPSIVRGQIIDETSVALNETTVDIYSSENNRLVDTVKTNENGEFLSIVPEDNYKLSISRENTLPIDAYLAAEDGLEVTMPRITMIESSLENEGKVTAKLRLGNSLDGSGLENIKVIIRRGYNNKTGEIVNTLAENSGGLDTDEEGYLLVTIPAGAYTLETKLEGYNSTFINLPVSQRIDYSTFVRSIPITNVLGDEEIRMTLEWGAQPKDLDSHLIGVDYTNGDFHIYYPLKGEVHSGSMLDKDDVNGNGFETTTIYQNTADGYTYSVFDYTNQGSYESMAMSNSGARVRVYKGSMEVAVFDIPTNIEGNLWEVFKIEDNKILPINRVTSHYDYSFYVY